MRPEPWLVYRLRTSAPLQCVVMALALILMVAAGVTLADMGR